MRSTIDIDYNEGVLESSNSTISRSDLKPGDVYTYGNTYFHVGFVTTDDGELAEVYIDKISGNLYCTVLDMSTMVTLVRSEKMRFVVETE